MPVGRVLAPVLLSCAACLYAQTPPQFLVTDLGVLPGQVVSAATSISDSGSVGGFSGSGSAFPNYARSTAAFVYSGNSLTAVSGLAFVTGVNSAGDLSGISSGYPKTFSGLVVQGGQTDSLGQVAFPVAINDADQVLVDGNTAGTLLIEPYISKNGVTSPVNMTFATGISQNGNISGWQGPNFSALDFASGVSPQVEIGGQVRNYQSPGGYPAGQAFAVNNSGVAAGSVYTAGYANAYAALFDNGTVTDLGTLPGMANSFAIGINNSGWVVGFSGNGWDGQIIGEGIGGTASQALLPNAIFVWPLSELFPPTQGYTAFLWISGKMYNLNPLVVNGTGWDLSFATAINSSGQIVGTGYHNGSQRAFLLTPVQVPAVGSVVGAGLSTPAVTSLSSGGLFTIFGTNFAAAGVTGSATTQNGVLQTKVANTCVEVGSEMAPLIYVSPTQINAQAPTLPVSGTISVSVVFDCGMANQTTSPIVNVPVAPASPEFLYLKQYASGQNPVAAVDSTTNAYVGPAGLFSGTTTTPATAGEVLTIYATGLGDTTPAQTPGTLASSAATVNGTVTVTIGGVDAQVLYAGVTPTFAGLYQINLVVPQLPQGSLPGNQPIVVNVNGVPSPVGAFLAAQ